MGRPMFKATNCSTSSAFGILGSSPGQLLQTRQDCRHWSTTSPPTSALCKRISAGRNLCGRSKSSRRAAASCLRKVTHARHSSKSDQPGKLLVDHSLEGLESACNAGRGLSAQAKIGEVGRGISQQVPDHAVHSHHRDLTEINDLWIRRCLLGRRYLEYLQHSPGGVRNQSRPLVGGDRRKAASAGSGNVAAAGKLDRPIGQGSSESCREVVSDGGNAAAELDQVRICDGVSGSLVAPHFRVHQHARTLVAHRQVLLQIFLDGLSKRHSGRRRATDPACIQQYQGRRRHIGCNAADPTLYVLDPLNLLGLSRLRRGGFELLLDAVGEDRECLHRYPPRLQQNLVQLRLQVGQHGRDFLCDVHGRAEFDAPAAEAESPVIVCELLCLPFELAGRPGPVDMPAVKGNSKAALSLQLAKNAGGELAAPAFAFLGLLLSSLSRFGGLRGGRTACPGALQLCRRKPSPSVHQAAGGVVACERVNRYQGRTNRRFLEVIGHEIRFSLERIGWRADAERGRRSGRALLLNDVRYFMGQQASAYNRRGSVSAGTKHNVVAHCVGSRRQSSSRVLRIAPRVDTNAAEIVSKTSPH